MNFVTFWTHMDLCRRLRHLLLRQMEHTKYFVHSNSKRIPIRVVSNIEHVQTQRNRMGRRSNINHIARTTIDFHSSRGVGGKITNCIALRSIRNNMTNEVGKRFESWDLKARKLAGYRSKTKTERGRANSPRSVFVLKQQIWLVHGLSCSWGPVGMLPVATSRSEERRCRERV